MVYIYIFAKFDLCMTNNQKAAFKLNAATWRFFEHLVFTYFILCFLLYFNKKKYQFDTTMMSL